MIVSLPSTIRAHMPPPLWHVTNGDVTVGPINTTMLVRGVAEGRVPERCYVRDTRNLSWRPVGAVREVKQREDQIYRRVRPELLDVETLSALVGLSESVRETMLLGLHIAMKRTRSNLGLVHTFDDAALPPVTRVSEGQGLDERVGRRLDERDPLPHMALSRHIVLGVPRVDHEFRAAALRLGGSPDAIAGVAMVPMMGERGVIGMIELGRADHAFRMTDALVLREVSRLVVERLDIIG